MSTDALLHTPLYADHVALNARMGAFAGWDMPISYQGILAEHTAVRQAVGVFDISHMGRVWVEGDGAADFVRRVSVNDSDALKPGEAQYSLLCRQDASTLDDILVYRFDSRWLIVVNAGNRERDIAFLQAHLPPSVKLRDETLNTAMLAIQGPAAVGLTRKLSQGLPERVRRYHAVEASLLGVPALFARTGYTGEDGFEVTLPASAAHQVWHELLEQGVPDGLQPCGLGARDTLRLEAGLPLYGHELTDTTTPFSAGLGRFCDPNKLDGIASSTLARLRATGDEFELFGVVLDSRTPARSDTPVFSGPDQIGVVTSGTFAPTVQRSIAIVRLRARSASEGSRVELEVRGQRWPASVVRLPFYRRTRPGAPGSL